MTPESYIEDTDYTTLKSDSAPATLIIAIPGGVAVPVFPTVLTYSASVTIGSLGAPMVFDINYSTNSRRYKTPELQFVENEAAANQYQGLVKVCRLSATTISVYVVIGTGAGPATTNARTVTVHLRTYIPPFS